MQFMAETFLLAAMLGSVCIVCWVAWRGYLK